MSWRAGAVPSVLLATAINLLIYIPIKAWRWRVALKNPPGFMRLMAALYEGLFASIAVGFGSGDAVRVIRLGHRPDGRVADYGGGGAERTAEAVALALLVAGTLGSAHAGWIAAAALVIVLYALLITRGERLVHRLNRWPVLKSFLEAGLAASTPGRSIAMIGLSLAGWLVEALMLALVLAAFGLPSDLATSLLTLVGINVAILLPGPPGNLGTFEAGAVAALKAKGVSTDAALAFAVSYHLLMALPVVAVAPFSRTCS